MKVSELIEELKKLPQDAPVTYTSDEGHVVYYVQGAKMTTNWYGKQVVELEG